MKNISVTVTVNEITTKAVYKNITITRAKSSATTITKISTRKVFKTKITLLCIQIPFQFGLKLSLDVNRVERHDNIDRWPANHERALRTTNDFGHFVDTRGHPHRGDVHAILQPQVLCSGKQGLNVNATRLS